MSTIPDEANNPVDRKPDPTGIQPAAAPEPPRILDRMLTEIETSVSEKLVAAGVRKPAEPTRQTITLPTHPLEPAPDSVFSPPPAKPPKTPFKGIGSRPPNSPNDTDSAALPHTDPTTSGPTREAPPPSPDDSSRRLPGPSVATESARPSPRGAWFPMITLALILLNLTLVIALLMFLFGAFQPRPQAPVAETEPPPSADHQDASIPAVETSATEPSPAPIPESWMEPEIPLPHLQISKLELVRGVTGFALYDPIPDMPLRPHHVPHMVAYIEFSHPAPEDRDDGRYVYNLTQSVRLYRADVGPTEPLMNTTASLVERGLSPRRDFHARQRLQSARPIQPGEHVVEVRLTDRNSGESVTEEVTFVIHSH